MTENADLLSSAAALAAIVDHTLLKPDATAAELHRWCDEAREYLFCSVCVNPVNVAFVTEALRGSGVKTCSVVSFPLGAALPEIKAAETAAAVRDGADEIDMVINVGALKDGRNDAVRADIAAVRAACQGKILKVIIETCLLDEAQKRTACQLSVEAGADFVKTSTGFSTGGATVADVVLMRDIVGEAPGVKASGGVRNWDAAQALIAAGATRLGASSGVALVTGAPVTGSGY